MPVSSPRAAPVGPQPTQPAKTGFRAWQWVVICGLGLASTVALDVLALMVMTFSPLNQATPNETAALIQPQTLAATQLPTSLLLPTPSETAAPAQPPTPGAYERSWFGTWWLRDEFTP